MVAHAATTENDRETLPEPLSGLRGLLGLPTHLELRAQLEASRLVRDSIWQRDALPSAKGRPILLVPGFMGHESSLYPMQSWLRRLGLFAKIAPVGFNAGPSAQGAAIVQQSLQRLADRCGEPVVLLGHSRGGQHATVASVRASSEVRALITLGSPLRFAHPRHFLTRVPVTTLRALGGVVLGPAARDAEDRYDGDLLAPFPTSVERVSIYSKSDGIVDWRASVVSNATCVEVEGSHIGLAMNAQVYRALVDALGDIFSAAHSPGRPSAGR